MSAPYVKLDIPVDETAIVCRGCLADSGVMKNMIEWGLQDDFFQHTSIPIRRTDGLSVLLCTMCEDALMTCKNFRTQCQNSDNALKDTAKKQPPAKTDQLYTNNTISYDLFTDKLVVKITAPVTDSKLYLTCPYHCEVTCLKKKGLELHMMKHHNRDKDFTIDLQYYCSYINCPYHVSLGKKKWFSGRKFLNQHYNKVHKRKIFHCDSCRLSFPTNAAFNRHLKTCNMSFLCEICDIPYNCNEKLLVHLMRKHPDIHKQYKNENKAVKRKLKTDTECKMEEYTFCDSPKRSFATQTLKPEDNIKNDVTLLSWQSMAGKNDYETKTDEISTQTVFEDWLSMKSQTSEDESLFFSETVSLSDIQTQTFPLEFGLSRSNKETITSETQSPDLSIKETQTCVCLYDSPKMNFRLFESVSSSPLTINLASTETQTSELRSPVPSDVLLGFHSTETQTCLESELDKDDM